MPTTNDVQAMIARSFRVHGTDGQCPMADGHDPMRDGDCRAHDLAVDLQHMLMLAENLSADNKSLVKRVSELESLSVDRKRADAAFGPDV